jgi:hypothetical protein
VVETPHDHSVDVAVSLVPNQSLASVIVLKFDPAGVAALQARSLVHARTVRFFILPARNQPNGIDFPRRNVVQTWVEQSLRPEPTGVPTLHVTRCGIARRLLPQCEADPSSALRRSYLFCNAADGCEHCCH